MKEFDHNATSLEIEAEIARRQWNNTIFQWDKSIRISDLDKYDIISAKYTSKGNLKLVLTNNEMPPFKLVLEKDCILDKLYLLAKEQGRREIINTLDDVVINTIKNKKDNIDSIVNNEEI